MNPYMVMVTTWILIRIKLFLFSGVPCILRIIPPECMAEDLNILFFPWIITTHRKVKENESENDEAIS